MYCAIIGDIKGSRKISNRDEVQNKLASVLKTVNQKNHQDIAANFLITIGDELQGLMSNAKNLIGIIKFIQMEMYPIKLRFGVGFGDINTIINREAAIGADGPAFYIARDIINNIHNQEKRFKKQAPDIQIGFFDKDYFEITQINTMLALLKSIEDGWSDKERLSIYDMLKYNNNQISCAKRLNTTQSTIARRLASGNYYVYKKSLSVINESIERLEFV